MRIEGARTHIYYVMTLFPDMIRQAVSFSIIGHAVEDGIVDIRPVNIRDYTTERHGHVDDEPYGGGAGMLMQVQPVYDCWKAVTEALGHRPRLLYMSPQGRTFDQQMAKELAEEEDLIFLCGHYEGIDERALELTGAECVSIGDYVLTCGELPALSMIDAVTRLHPGVLKKAESHEIESFSDGLLEYPQYTRPEVYEGLRVPEVLLSGHHANIAAWRHAESLRRTELRRPDLYEAYRTLHPEEFEPPKKRRKKKPLA